MAVYFFDILVNIIECTRKILLGIKINFTYLLVDIIGIYITND